VENKYHFANVTGLLKSDWLVWKNRDTLVLDKRPSLFSKEKAESRRNISNTWHPLLVGLETCEKYKRRLPQTW
jgi:hypothetical protein